MVDYPLYSQGMLRRIAESAGEPLENKGNLAQQAQHIFEV
jgi:hypothetical protein